MDKFEFFPDRKRLGMGAALGAALAFVGYWIQPAMGKETAAPLLLALAFGVIGVVLLLRSLYWLLRPRPCLVGDAYGFSVMGKARRGWEDLGKVDIRTVTVFMIPFGKWVSLELRKSEDGPARRYEIPWTHLPGPADDTVAAICELVGKRKRKAPASEPRLAYDPYDPAALERARARAT